MTLASNEHPFINEHAADSPSAFNVPLRSPLPVWMALFANVLAFLSCRRCSPSRRPSAGWLLRMRRSWRSCSHFGPIHEV